MSYNFTAINTSASSSSASDLANIAINVASNITTNTSTTALPPTYDLVPTSTRRYIEDYPNEL